MAWQEANHRGVASALSACRNRLADRTAFTLHYLEAVNPYTFEVMSNLEEPPTGPFAIALAASLEGVRLLDNIVRWK
jgi:pantothenate synthetase